MHQIDGLVWISLTQGQFTLTPSYLAAFASVWGLIWLPNWIHIFFCSTDPHRQSKRSIDLDWAGGHRVWWMANGKYITVDASRQNCIKFMALLSYLLAGPFFRDYWLSLGLGLEWKVTLLPNKQCNLGGDDDLTHLVRCWLLRGHISRSHPFILVMGSNKSMGCL